MKNKRTISIKGDSKQKQNKDKSINNNSGNTKNKIQLILTWVQIKFSEYSENIYAYNISLGQCQGVEPGLRK